MSGLRLIVLVGTLSLPAIFLRLTGTHLGTVADTSIFGLAIIAAAFLLAWGAEASEVDISQSLAVAFVALIAVLPEYAVDMTYAWKAGNDPSFAPVRRRKHDRRQPAPHRRGVADGLLPVLAPHEKHVLRLEHGHAVEIVALAIATAYSFTIPLKGEIAL